MMKHSPSVLAPHFLLIGNGPYLNRGCEAIVRGTMAILERSWGDDLSVTLGTLDIPEIVMGQAESEQDRRITHIPILPPPIHRWSAPWWKRRIRRATSRGYERDNALDALLANPASAAGCALQVGGDNYTLDYGRPHIFMAMDQYFFSRNIPVILWGASVGPFDSDPVFAAGMHDHLRKMKAIFVRERESLDYLKSKGVEANVYLVADPAFVMSPCRPRLDSIGCPISEGAVGVNFSPLMAKYITGGDIVAWTDRCVEIVRCIVEITRRDVILIPHVTVEKSNDYKLLSNIARVCQDHSLRGVACVLPGLSAAETKWVISQCAVFVGARTHATIGAISSSVPTISLAYSRKARGLNQDIFGCQDFCIEPRDMLPEVITERVLFAMEHAGAIRAQIAAALPPIREAAYRSGEILRSIVSSSQLKTL